MDGRFIPTDEGLELPAHEPVSSDAIEEIWPLIVRFLNGLDTWGQRMQARKILIGRLKHPEMDAHPESAVNVHPKQRSAGPQPSAASCARCGSPRRYHDIDGQHDGCDGYVEQK